MVVSECHHCFWLLLLFSLQGCTSWAAVECLSVCRMNVWSSVTELCTKFMSVLCLVLTACSCAWFWWTSHFPYNNGCKATCFAIWPSLGSYITTSWSNALWQYLIRSHSIFLAQSNYCMTHVATPRAAIFLAMFDTQLQCIPSASSFR